VIGVYTRWARRFHTGFRVVECDRFTMRAYVISLKPISRVN